MTVAPALTPGTGTLPLTGFVMADWVVRVHGTTGAGAGAGAAGAGTGAAVTVIDRALAATLPPESVTSTVIGATCTVVGVPEITPVAVFKVSPAGSVPLVSAHDE